MPAEDSPKPPVSEDWLRHVLADVAAVAETRDEMKDVSGGVVEFSLIDAYFAAAKKYEAPFDDAVAYYVKNTIEPHALQVCSSLPKSYTLQSHSCPPLSVTIAAPW